MKTLVGVAASIMAGLILARYFQARSRHQELRLREERIAAICQAQHAMQHAGEEAESQVAQRILEIVQKLDPTATVRTGVIMYYPRSASGQLPKFEIDCLIISTFGVLAVEVKNWRGSVEIHPDGWTVTKGDKKSHHRSPLAQNSPKVRAIEEIVRSASETFPVEGVVVMSHEGADLPLDAPLSVLTRHQLLYFIRSLYHASKRRGIVTSEKITAVRKAIDAATDSSADAKHKFLLELSRRNIGAHEYASLQREREQLERSPLPVQRSLWRHPIMYLPLLSFLIFSSMSDEWLRSKEQLPKVAVGNETKGRVKKTSLDRSKGASKRPPGSKTSGTK